MSNETYEYDIAISYAGEDRSYAEALADVLRNRGVHVFYDKYEKAVLWGQDLYTYLSDLYQNKSRYCILFLSKYYAAKLWTKHELQSAQARALREQNAYILPIRLDNTQIPGILPTTGYLDWSQETPETIADLLVEKLRAVSQDYSTFAKRLSQETIVDFVNEATSKVVLILGRFTPERKAVLDAVKNELSKYNFVPILFDFEKPANRDFTETVSTLAHLARFVIVDLTDPASIIQELYAIVPILAVPVQPILLAGNKEFSMFEDLRRYHWVLPTFRYQDKADLLDSLQEHIIEPAEQKALELEKH
jgi:TIR domain